MLSIQSSMYQQYHQYKNKIDVSIPYSEQKKRAAIVIRNIAQTIFEKFGCGSLFNDDCIKNFGDMNNPANFKVTLLNFQPTKSIFAFLSSIRRGHFLSVSNECTFSTNEFGMLFDIKFSYSFLERSNSGFIRNKVFICFDSNFDLADIRYERINDRPELLISVSKTKDMLCPIENEILFLELFFNYDNSELRELFPSFFRDGVYIFENHEIESNSILARMLLI